MRQYPPPQQSPPPTYTLDLSNETLVDNFKLKYELTKLEQHCNNLEMQNKQLFESD